jgi:lipid II:glycine glycyltransferase (peptidoglycan interpeptide bridge formation enzyme)
MQIPFTQTKEYLGWQESVGNKTFYKEFFGSDGDLQIVAAGVILNTRAGKVLYFPFGPVVDENCSEGTWDEFVAWAKDIAKKQGCVFIRVEKNRGGAESAASSIFSPLVKTYSKEGLWQPRLEWVLDLNKNQNEIYESFSKNCRYSIRRSEKEIDLGNVRIEIVENNFQEYFSDFIELMKETSGRNGFLNHEEKYFEKVFESLQDGRMNGYLVVGKVKAGSTQDKGNLMDVGEEAEWVTNSIVVVVLDNAGSRVNYVYGGSKNFKRELGVSYKVQFEAIKKAIDFGCIIYNFGGITGEFEAHTFGRETLSGVTNFKKQFGGRQNFNGYFYDLPIKKLKYFLYLVYKMVR